MRIVAKMWAFFKRDLLNVSSYRFAFVSQLGGVLFSSLSMYFLSRLISGANPLTSLERYGGDYFSFVLVGLALTGYVEVALSSYPGAIREAQIMGHLEALLSCRSTLATIVLGSSLYPFVWATLRVVMYLVVGGLLLGAIVGKASLFAALTILLLSIAAHSAIGILAAGVVIVFKKWDPFTGFFSTASQLLAGVYYPLSVLPAWLRPICKIFPLTHSLEGMRRAVILGEPIWRLWQPIGALTIFTIVMLPVSLVAFSACVKYAKKAGTLAEY